MHIMWSMSKPRLPVGAAAVASAVALMACTEPPRRVAEEGPIFKPTAAVTMTVDARDIGNGAYRVTLVVTPNHDADALQLRLEPKQSGTPFSGPTLLQFGQTRAGVRRELVAEMRPQSAMAGLLFGHAGITIGPSTRSKSIYFIPTELPHLDSGPSKPAGPPIRDITLPDGTRVAETRP